MKLNDNFFFILEWSAQKVPPLPELEEMNEKQLGKSLSRFYTEARNKKGNDCRKSSLKVLGEY